MTPDSAIFRPFRATGSQGASVPRALPWAYLLRPLGAEEEQPDIEWFKGLACYCRHAGRVYIALKGLNMKPKGNALGISRSPNQP